MLLSTGPSSPWIDVLTDFPIHSFTPSLSAYQHCLQGASIKAVVRANTDQGCGSFPEDVLAKFGLESKWTSLMLRQG